LKKVLFPFESVRPPVLLGPALTLNTLRRVFSFFFVTLSFANLFSCSFTKPKPPLNRPPLFLPVFKICYYSINRFLPDECILPFSLIFRGLRSYFCSRFLVFPSRSLFPFSLIVNSHCCGEAVFPASFPSAFFCPTPN